MTAGVLPGMFGGGAQYQSRSLTSLSSTGRVPAPCVGIMATFAWEKAVGDEDELAWWATAALAGARWLG